MVVDLVGAMRKVHSDNIQTTYAKLAAFCEKKIGKSGLTFAKQVDLLNRVCLWTYSELC